MPTGELMKPALREFRVATRLKDGLLERRFAEVLVDTGELE